jgi:hypothetical protein
MPEQSTERRALVVTSDLFFRAKLAAALEQAGWVVSWCGTAPLAVVELGSPHAMSRIQRLVASGSRVIAFGSHVSAELLREARKAGALAVPNSEVERVLREEIAGS